MSKSVIDGNRKYVLYWPWDNATHLTIMKSHAAAKGVRTSGRSWQLGIQERRPEGDFNAVRYVGWIYELQKCDGGIRLELIDDDRAYLDKWCPRV